MQMYAIARFSKWLCDRPFDLRQVDEATIERFLKRDPGVVHSGESATLRRLLAMLRRVGVTLAKVPEPGNCQQRFIDDYRHYLLRERGLAEATLLYFVRFAEQFISGRWGTMTHDYKRNGTTTLFAALETLQGKVVGECYERHRHQEFLKFLRLLDAEFPGDIPLHLITDNYGTHKHSKVKAWLKRHPRFVAHFVPTSSSWMNLVERWFGHLDSKAIRRGVFRSVADLQTSIETFLKVWNKNPKPFVWTATVESIQEKLTRCRQTLERVQPGCTSPKSRKRKR